MTDTDEPSAQEYDVVVVGGGPAGLTAALYATRLGNRTALVDRGGGRAAMMLDTHNVIGVTEDVSGNEFLATAREQVQEYGADLHRDMVTGADRAEDGRVRLTANSDEFLAERVVFATGFSDGHPDPPLPRTGKGLHYCLHCDAYMFVDESVYVMGHGEGAAHVAMIMLNFTGEVDILLRGDDPTWSEETAEQLAAHPIDLIDEDVTGIEKGEDGWLEALAFEDGTVREYRGGFAMYGSAYNTALAESLGCELNDDGTVATDDHGRTSVEDVFAVGDVVPGHNQIPVAMGEGAKTGIAIHKDLRAFPRSLESIRASGPVTPEETPAMDPALRETARSFRGAEAAESESEPDAGAPADD